MPVQDALFDELKATMDVQATLIAHKDKEPTEATKCLHPLTNEVYTKVLAKKYKCPTFMKFDGDGNLENHIIIF